MAAKFAVLVSVRQNSSFKTMRTFFFFFESPQFVFKCITLVALADKFVLFKIRNADDTAD